MFNQVINVKKRSELRYGQTNIPFDDTFASIMKLLKKHGCNKILTYEADKNHFIAFELNTIPYKFQIPKVYVDTIYDDKIGIRIAFRYLETLLELVKERVIDVEFLLLGSRIINTPKGTMTLKDAIEKLPKPEVFLLPEGNIIEDEVIDIKTEE